MAGSDEDHGRSGRPGAEDRRWSSIGRVTSCVICTVHKETSSVGFLVEPQNQGRRVFRFRPQNWQLRVGDLGLKITMTVS
jgi:hypothetical protein